MPPVGFLPQAAVWSAIQRFAIGYSFQIGFRITVQHQLSISYDIIMYITSIVFTLIAWGAGLLLDANIHFGDPQGFLGLRVLLPVLAMGLCLLRAMKEDKRNGDK